MIYLCLVCLLNYRLCCCYVCLQGERGADGLSIPGPPGPPGLPGPVFNLQDVHTAWPHTHTHTCRPPTCVPLKRDAFLHSCTWMTVRACYPSLSFEVHQDLRWADRTLLCISLCVCVCVCVFVLCDFLRLYEWDTNCRSWLKTPLVCVTLHVIAKFQVCSMLQYLMVCVCLCACVCVAGPWWLAW